MTSVPIDKTRRENAYVGPLSLMHSGVDPISAFRACKLELLQYSVSVSLIQHGHYLFGLDCHARSVPVYTL